MVCLPVGPRCNSCDLSNGLCPSANKGVSKAKLKGKKIAGKATVEDASPDKGGPKIEISVEQEDEKLEKL